MRTLLLWDIDGTLIASGGAGMRALRKALQLAFEIDGELDDIDFAGRTDRWIMRQIFAKFSLPNCEENFVRYRDAYLSLLPGELSHPAARVLPGVREILATCAADTQIAQGLLTGNIQSAAEKKLRHHGLWDYFAFGAFADDSELRNDLGPHALLRAAAHHRFPFTAAHAWVIGDTPHDIACGKIINARTLAVATGNFTVEALALYEPTAVRADLQDTAEILHLLQD